jgi:hypothetical protein
VVVERILGYPVLKLAWIVRPLRAPATGELDYIVYTIVQQLLQIVNFVVVWVLFLQKSDDIGDVVAVHSLYFLRWITHGDYVVSYV